MPILFCNVGWMKHYDGIQNDSIERGGECNEHSNGHEVCNFADRAGTLYGYVQPSGRAIKIEKLGAADGDDSVDGVTVVWTASPEAGGTVVVGWYKNATVYRDAQQIPKPTPHQVRNGVDLFRIKARSADAVLLPVTERDLIVPRAVKGGIGQSNVWFADKPEGAALVKRALALVRRGRSQSLPDIDLTMSVLEGNPRLVAHLRRERSTSLAKAKRAAILRTTGRLCCEICDFDFGAKYGTLGEGYCEVHHLQALSKSDGTVETKLKDLAIVCSNCHRVIHRTDPMPTIKDLKGVLRRRDA